MNSTNGQHYQRNSRSRNSNKKQTTKIKQAFYIWILLTSCSLVIFNQIRTTKKAVKLSSSWTREVVDHNAPASLGKNGDSQFRTHKNLDRTRDLVASDDNNNNDGDGSWYLEDVLEDEDGVGDDDNIFDDDDSGDFANDQDDDEEFFQQDEVLQDDEDEKEESNHNNEQAEAEEEDNEESAKEQGETETQQQQQQQDVEVDREAEKLIQERIVEIRAKMDDYAHQHGGKVDQPLLEEYHAAVQAKREFVRKRRQGYYQGVISQKGGGGGGIGRFGRTNPFFVKPSKGTTYVDPRQKELDKYIRGAKAGGNNKELFEKAYDNREEYLRAREEKKRRRKELFAWKPPNADEDFSKYPILPSERVLPDMNTSKGGVIFFLHIPKTGGSTIRQFSMRFRKRTRRVPPFATRPESEADRRKFFPGGRLGATRNNNQHGAMGVRLLSQEATKGKTRQDNGNLLLEAQTPSEEPDRRRLMQAVHENFNDESRRFGRLGMKRSAITDKLWSREQMRPFPGVSREERKPLTPQIVEFDELTRKRVKFISSNVLEVFYEKAIPAVNQLFEKGMNDNTNGEIVFVEVHGMDNFHALELEPYLHYWREQSKKSGVPFFSFTLLREAIACQVSFFNYYWVHPGDDRFCKNPLKPNLMCKGEGKEEKVKLMVERKEKRREYAELRARDRKGEELTEEEIERMQELQEELKSPFKKPENHANGIQGITQKQLQETMVKHTYDNPQCLFLARGERTFGDSQEQKDLRNVPLKRKHCQEVYMSMQRTMDWIGATETMSKETLPLLTHMMFGKGELGGHLIKKNVSPDKEGYVMPKKLLDSTVKGLEPKSQLDQEMYHRAIEDYTIDQFINIPQPLDPTQMIL